MLNIDHILFAAIILGLGGLSTLIVAIYFSIKTIKIAKQTKYLINENASLRYQLDRIKNPEPSNPEEWSAAVKQDMVRRQSASDLDFSR